MKNIQFHESIWFKIKGVFMIGVLIGSLSTAFCQAEEENLPSDTQKDSTLVEDEGVPEKMTLRMSFEAFKINDEMKLTAKVRYKVKGKFQNIPNVEVSFYSEEAGTKTLLGKDTSNHIGEAYWILPVSQNSDSAGSIQYWAVVQNHTDYEDAEETVSVHPAFMELLLEEEDSVKLVKVFVGYPDETGQIMPVVEAECQLYVKRLFGLMPIGESETTDEEGRITIEFPADIHGDESGNLTVVAQITEHEIVGNVEANENISWGIPLTMNDFYHKRELWSARANSPIALIIIVNAVLLGIWGMIAFIFLEIIRINKLGKMNS